MSQLPNLFAEDYKQDEQHCRCNGALRGPPKTKWILSLRRLGDLWRPSGSPCWIGAVVDPGTVNLREIRDLDIGRAENQFEKRGLVVLTQNGQRNWRVAKVGADGKSRLSHATDQVAGSNEMPVGSRDDRRGETTGEWGWIRRGDCDAETESNTLMVE